MPAAACASPRIASPESPPTPPLSLIRAGCSHLYVRTRQDGGIGKLSSRPRPRPEDAGRDVEDIREQLPQHSVAANHPPRTSIRAAPKAQQRGLQQTPPALQTSRCSRLCAHVGAALHAARARRSDGGPGPTRWHRCQGLQERHEPRCSALCAEHDLVCELLGLYRLCGHLARLRLRPAIFWLRRLADLVLHHHLRGPVMHVHRAPAPERPSPASRPALHLRICLSAQNWVGSLAVGCWAIPIFVMLPLIVGQGLLLRMLTQCDPSIKVRLLAPPRTPRPLPPNLRMPDALGEMARRAPRWHHQHARDDNDRRHAGQPPAASGRRPRFHTRRAAGIEVRVRRCRCFDLCDGVLIFVE